MQPRNFAARELADLLGILSHPCRVQIIEELRSDERNVNALQEVLGISHSGVSQHLALLRGHKLLKERRSGRHVYYRLSDPNIAEWLCQGVVVLEKLATGAADQKPLLQQAIQQWTPSAEHSLSQGASGETASSESGAMSTQPHFDHQESSDPSVNKT